MSRYCSGTVVIHTWDHIQTWDNVEQATVKIILKDYEVSIETSLQSLQLIFSLGQRCDARRGEYIDFENRQIL